jgi:hypothetical protein
VFGGHSCLRQFGGVPTILGGHSGWPVAHWPCLKTAPGGQTHEQDSMLHTLPPMHRAVLLHCGAS